MNVDLLVPATEQEVEFVLGYAKYAVDIVTDGGGTFYWKETAYPNVEYFSMS